MLAQMCQRHESIYYSFNPNFLSFKWKILSQKVPIMDLMPWSWMSAQCKHRRAQVAQTHTMLCLLCLETSQVSAALLWPSAELLLTTPHTHVEDEVCGSSSIPVVKGSVLSWCHGEIWFLPGKNCGCVSGQFLYQRWGLFSRHIC